MSLPVANQPKASNLSDLDERIQRWVWQKGWTGLRDAQAIPGSQAEQDVIIAAATASSKTERHSYPFFPALSGGEEMNVCRYISPLKALINDQWGPWISCARIEYTRRARNGSDIVATRKHNFMKRPQGVYHCRNRRLVVLPEHELKRYFGELQYVVVDELHCVYR